MPDLLHSFFISTYPEQQLSLPDFSAHIRLLEPGIISFSVRGFVHPTAATELLQLTHRLQQQLGEIPGTFYIIVDADQLTGISLGASRELLRELQWAYNPYCLGVELSSSSLLLNNFFRLLFRLKRVNNYHIYNSGTEALTFARKQLQAKGLDTGGELPLGYQAQPLPDYDYRDEEGNSHYFYLLNRQILLLQMFGAIRAENILHMLRAQQEIATKHVLPNYPNAPIIVDVSHLTRHDAKSRTALGAVREFLREHPSPYRFSYVIVPVSIRGVLRTLTQLIPSMQHKLRPVDSIAEALHTIAVKPAVKSFSMPISRSKMQALILKQQQEIEQLKQEQFDILELFSRSFTHLILDPDFRPEFIEPPSHKGEAYRGAVDLLNYVQIDIRDLLDTLQREALSREQAQQEAQMANQIKSQFLANMSHEIRTPMNAILGFTHIILERYPTELPAKVHQYLKRIHENGKHLLALINDVLDLSRIEAGEVNLALETIDLKLFLSQLLEQFEGNAREQQIQLVLAVPAPIFYLESDPAKLRQILVNLIGNALKFTPSGGSITLGLEVENDHPTAIIVQDTGIGIPQDKQQTIFERFTQVPEAQTKHLRGTGLGLAISQSLGGHLGYHLSVNSTPGQGATFRLKLTPPPKSPSD